MSVRKMLANLPGLRKAYHATPFFKAKERRFQEVQRLHAEERKRVQEHLFRLAFNDDLTVRFGPFAGMRYLPESSGSQVLPKVLGSYEEPVQPWIEEIIAGGKYELILDIGCAEGYYAVGFAMRMPNAQIHAFDIDPCARELAGRLTALNNVGNRVLLHSECTFEVFQKMGGPRTLIFCDIEGNEDDLLDPLRAPRLADCGIFVEAHDAFVPGVSERLITRFASSHKIRMIVDYPGRLAAYSLPEIDALTSDDLAKLTDEVRPASMRFYFMEPLSHLTDLARANPAVTRRKMFEGSRENCLPFAPANLQLIANGRLGASAIGTAEG